MSNCKACNKEFSPRTYKSECCSRACRRRLEKRRHRARERESAGFTTRECRGCGKEFKPQTRNHVYCCKRPLAMMLRVPAAMRPAPTPKPRKTCPLCSAEMETYQKRWCKRCARIIDSARRQDSRFLLSAANLASKEKLRLPGFHTTACEVCSSPVGPGTWHRHHIVPRSKGGENKLTNIAVLCEPCHFAIHRSPLYIPEFKAPSSRDDFLGLCKMLDIGAAAA